LLLKIHQPYLLAWENITTGEEERRVNMLTNEGADDAEIIIRPAEGGVWRVEVPRYGGVLVKKANDQDEALSLARRLCPKGQIRLLPAEESPETLNDELPLASKRRGVDDFA
jgi:hypothetical protein